MLIFLDNDGRKKHISEIRANLYEIRFPGSKKAFIAGWVECLDRMTDMLELMTHDMDPEAEESHAEYCMDQTMED